MRERDDRMGKEDRERERSHRLCPESDNIDFLMICEHIATTSLH